MKRLMTIVAAAVIALVGCISPKALHAQSPRWHYDVQVTLNKIYTTGSECWPETYMVLFVNGWRFAPIWKDRTDMDITTIQGCMKWVSIKRTFTTINLAENQPLRIQLQFFEKDGHYHTVAENILVLGPGQWISEGGRTDTLYSVPVIDSRSHWGDYADEDYVLEYTVKAVPKGVW